MASYRSIFARFVGRKSSILTHRSLYKLSELVRYKECMQNGHLLVREIRLDAFLSVFLRSSLTNFDTSSEMYRLKRIVS